MRAVFVNHCHPKRPHVCAVRAREFATALAQRDHRIVLLTETLLPDDPAETPGGLARRIALHDWREPLFAACHPAGHSLLRRQRAGSLPAALRKPLVAGYYSVAGSVFCDWGRGAAPFVPALAQEFRPDVVWANFGNTECLRIARALAAAAACPWVLDVKDYWSTFIPSPFRRSLGRRFGDARAMTALSQGHVEDVRADFPVALTNIATPIHSGVPDSLLADAPASIADAAERYVLIVGAIYDPARLAALMTGIAAAAAATGAPVGVAYAGDEASLVRDAARAAGLGEIADHGYLPLDRLHALQRTALANAFVRSGPGWFQHKVPELLTAARPILCIPAADAETTDLAARAKVPFFNCETAGDVAAALTAAARTNVVAPDRDLLASLSWARRAEELERALEDACR